MKPARALGLVLMSFGPKSLAAKETTEAPVLQSKHGGGCTKKKKNNGHVRRKNGEKDKLITCISENQRMRKSERESKGRHLFSAIVAAKKLAARKTWGGRRVN